MPKRKETLELEEALIKDTRQKRIYGCEEVTIGFYNNGHGNEIADFMTMDSKGIIKCYELKVTMQDLKSSAKKSWYGNYNYLVISNDLYCKIKDDFSSFIPDHVGVIYGKYLQSAKRAKKMDISQEDSMMLKEGLVRSMYWKMDKYRDAKSLEKQKRLNKELDKALKNSNEYYTRACNAERLIHHYERCRKYNEDLEDFCFEEEVEKERVKYLAKREKIKA